MPATAVDHAFAAADFLAMTIVHHSALPPLVNLGGGGEGLDLPNAEEEVEDLVTLGLDVACKYNSKATFGLDKF